MPSMTAKLFTIVLRVRVRGVARIATGVLLLAALAMLSGCTQGLAESQPSRPTDTASSSSPPGRWQPSGSAEPGGAEDDLTLPTPLAAYALSARESATVDYARRLLLKDCLARFGFDYPVSPYRDMLAREIADEKEGVGRWFGITDREMANVQGMLLPELSQAELATPEGLSGPAFEMAFGGSLNPKEGGSSDAPSEIDGVVIPKGGCAGEVDRKLGRVGQGTEGLGGVDGQDQARMLIFASYGQFQDLEDYQQLQREWASCMSKAGYSEVKRTYNDPFVTDLIKSRESPDKPTQKEVDFALQFIDCMESVDLQDRALKLLVAFHQELIDKHQLELQENRKNMDEQVRRATDEIEKLGGFE